jgi:hypothetical protein
MIYEDTNSVTSLQASEAGAMPSDSRDGRMTEKSGLEAVPANLSPRQAKEKEPPTNAISGPSGSISSASLALQSSLESKLPPRFAKAGGTLFKQTWKRKVTPAGWEYMEHTASGRRIRDNDCTSWPTPQTFDASNNGTPRPLRYKGNAPSEAGNTRDPNKAGSYRGDLKDYAGMVEASWATPTTRDHKDGACQEQIENGTVPVNGLLGRQVLGATVTGSPVGMVNRGQLRPEFSLWLMGFPTEWARCAELVTPSSRKSRKRS